jgi:hypothetical protein
VHKGGGTNAHSGEPVNSAEERVHGVGLILEQKETKKTKKFRFAAKRMISAIQIERSSIAHGLDNRMKLVQRPAARFLTFQVPVELRLKVVSAVLGSNLAELANDVCLHLLKRSEQLIELSRAHGRSEREQGAAGKRSAAKRTLELHDAQAIMLDVRCTTGQRLRQSAHHVTGALIQHAQRGSKSLFFVTKERT